MSDPIVSHTVLPATVDASALTTNPNRRAPFGWPVFAFDDHQPAYLTFRQKLSHRAHLRLAVAIDVRTPATLSVQLTKTKQTLCEADLGYATPLQLIDIQFTAEEAAEASTQGLSLVRSDPADAKQHDRRLFFFGSDETYATFAPRLIAPAKVEPLAAFMARLSSPASLAPFGWMQASVLDALIDLKQNKAVQSHLEYFFDTSMATYEDAHSRPQDGRVHGIETCAMYACLGRVDPDHALLDQCLAYLQERRQFDGTIRDQLVLAEHTHCIAYPLAVIGRARGDQKLMQMAIEQLRLRRDRLRIGGQLYGRTSDDGRLDLKNDSRSAGLYLLGIARTLSQVGQGFIGADDLTREAQLVAHWLIKRQRPDGLWSPVLDDPEKINAQTAQQNPADTNASAAIGAALALLAQAGLGEQTQAAAKRALSGLFKFLTPDGMLTGAAPAYKNQGGVELARTHRRVISQAAMGFTGQIVAALKSIPLSDG